MLDNFPSASAQSDASPYERARELYAAVISMLKQSYDEMQRSLRTGTAVNRVGHGMVMSAATMMGFITKPPGRFTLPFEDLIGVRPNLAEERGQLAGLWLVASPQNTSKGSRNYRADCLVAFCERLTAFLEESRNTKLVTKREIRRQPEIDHMAGIHSRYTNRPELETKLAQALKRSQVVVLVGEGGVGKTRLATEFVKSKPNAVILSATSEDQLIHSLRRGLGEGSWLAADSAVKARFFEMLEVAADAPDYVVIDDVSSWDTVSRLVPPSPASKIIITARTRLARGACEYVPIGSLTREEAVRLIQTYLPGATLDEHLALTMLGGRALAITQCAAYLRESGRQARDAFAELLLNDPVLALDHAAGSLGEQAIKSIYSKIIAALQQEPETASAVRLLEFIAAPKSLDVLATTEMAFIRAHESESEGLTAWRVGKEILERYELVQLTERPAELRWFNDPKTSEPGALVPQRLGMGREIHVHSLTLSMLHEIFDWRLMLTLNERIFRYLITLESISHESFGLDQESDFQTIPPVIVEDGEFNEQVVVGLLRYFQSSMQFHERATNEVVAEYYRAWGMIGDDE